MRSRLMLVASALVLAACSANMSDESMSDVISIVPDYANSSATSMDAAGIGGAQFPEGLRLTTEQKAAIDALHETFRAATSADMDALRAIETQARAAKQNGKSADEVRAIIATGAPILARINAAFNTLQAAIAQVYTAEQRAWIESHRPRPCGPGGPPRLTDAQKQQMRALQEAFSAAIHADVESIRQVAESAHHAAENGATREQVQQILHQADAAQGRVRAAEMKLQQDIDALLTAEQRAARCQPQGPGPGAGPMMPHG